MRKVLIYFLLVSFLPLSACSLIHHVEVQQGNVITQKMVNKLRPGMTKRQVQVAMGTPMVVDVFQHDRWDYLYYLKSSTGAEVQRTVSIYFKDNKLTEVIGDLTPTESLDEDSQRQEISSVTVPYQDRERKGVLNRLWKFLTFRNRGEETQ